jgi:hypothetical protein
MPLNPLIQNTLRRNRPAVVAIVLLLGLVLVNQLWFRPTAQRYARALKLATELGMPLDPNQMPRIMPPRLFAVIADNTLPAAQAQDQANSGSLTAEFLSELTQRMGQRNVTVLSTEPGPTTQDPHSIQLRAHLRARGRYADLVMLLDDFARDRRLFALDRFNLVADGTGGATADLYLSRLVLKGGTAQ